MTEVIGGPMNLAFRHLALGDFEIGLSKLNKDRKWRDDRLDLDGPFRLGFPQAPGWGEELLVASLLKRYAAASNSRITAFGSWQVCSILKGDPVLQGEESGHNTQGRPPLAILRCALLGNLLENPFARLSSVCPLQLNRRRRVGIAWSSVEKNRPISYKSVPVERFLPILAAIKADFISLQRRRDVADPNCLLHEPDVRVLPDEVVTAATEGSLYKLVEEIRDLDCVVTVSTTTAHMAAAMGIRVELIAAEREGQQWFWQVQARHQRCFYPTVHVHLGNGTKDNWWENPVESVRASLSRLENGGK